MLFHTHHGDSWGLQERHYSERIKISDIPYRIVLYLKLYYCLRSDRHISFWRVGVGACTHLWDPLLNSSFWVLTRRPGIPSRHIDPHSGPRGGCHWIIPPPPVTACVSSVLPRVELKYFSCAYVTGFRSLSPAFLTGIVLRAPTAGGVVFIFLKKIRGKTFCKASSPLPRTSLLCPRWRVEEICIIIVFHC